MRSDGRCGWSTLRRACRSPNGVIPSARISPQAAALLRYYPAPNVDSERRYNYQTPVLVDDAPGRAAGAAHRNARSARTSYSATCRGSGRPPTPAMSSGSSIRTRVSGVDAPINWSHRISQFLSFRLRYQYTPLTTTRTPISRIGENVSGEAGIAGNNQDPVNWGRRRCCSRAASPRSPTRAVRIESRPHARRRRGSAVESRPSQRDAAAAIYRLPPARHLIAAERARQLHVHRRYDRVGCRRFPAWRSAYQLDRVRQRGQVPARDRPPTPTSPTTGGSAPTLTANIGAALGIRIAVYRTPRPTRQPRYRAGFHGVAPSAALRGMLTGRRYPRRCSTGPRGFQPRLGVAWRPVPGSSLVVRAVTASTATRRSIRH